MRKLLAEGIDLNEAYNYKRKLEKCDKDLQDLLKEEQLIKLKREDQEEEND